MKKLFFIIFVFISVSVLGQEQNPNALEIHFTNGQTQSIALDSIDYINFIKANIDDDEPKGGNIIGSWQEDDEWTNALGTKQYLMFTSDGVVFEVDIFPEYLGGDIEVAKGKYSVSGNTIKVYDFDPNYEYKVDGESTIVKLTEDKLVLSTMGMEQRYKRVADDIVDKYIKDYK